MAEQRDTFRLVAAMPQTNIAGFVTQCADSSLYTLGDKPVDFYTPRLGDAFTLVQAFTAGFRCSGGNVVARPAPGTGAYALTWSRVITPADIITFRIKGKKLQITTPTGSVLTLARGSAAGCSGLVFLPESAQDQTLDVVMEKVEPSTMSAGTIAAIVFSSIAALAIIIVLAVLFFRKSAPAS